MATTLTVVAGSVTATGGLTALLVKIFTGRRQKK
jgi:hypothetical protein